jgi:hypothetical protein
LTGLCRGLIIPALIKTGPKGRYYEGDAVLSIFVVRCGSAHAGCFKIFGGINAARGGINFANGNAHSSLKRAKLFQLFRLLQRRWRQGNKTGKRITAPTINANMMK